MKPGAFIMMEQRHHKRFYVSIDIIAWLQATFSIGHVVNLSMGGLAYFCSSPKTPCQAGLLQLSCRDYAFMIDDIIVRPVEKRIITDNGSLCIRHMHFPALTASQKKRLASFLNRHGFLPTVDPTLLTDEKRKKTALL